MIRDHVITSFHIERDDLDMDTFDGAAGLGKMLQLFGDRTDPLIAELNEVLAHDGNPSLDALVQPCNRAIVPHEP